MTQPPTHACPGQCGTQVPHHRLACPTCWDRLPSPLRLQVTTAYRNRLRDAATHLRAVSTALTWYRHNNPTREDHS